MSRPEIVFFGSGPVAAQSLELLVKDFTVLAVVTKPKPAHHRGSVPVIDTAEKLKLPFFTVTDKKELSKLIATKPFQTEIAVLIDFGIIVAQEVIDYFPKGIINSHFSLLPEWRGADPITFSILSGQKQTGVSLMLLVEKMDEGPLLAQGIYDIKTDETTPSLTDYLIKLSAALLQDAVPKYLTGDITPRSQNIVAEMMQASTEPTYSRKLTKEDGQLDWNKPAEQLEREIRAFIEWPKSSTILGQVELTVTQASVINKSGKAGTITTDNNQLAVYCGQQALSIEKLKPAGKTEMAAAAFLNGYKDKLY